MKDKIVLWRDCRKKINAYFYVKNNSCKLKIWRKNLFSVFLQKQGDIMAADYVQIHINGNVGTENLSPDNYDIADLKDLINNIYILFEATNGKSRPIVSFETEHGSFIGRFKSTVQAVALAGAVISLVQQTNSLDGLNTRVADVFVNIQKAARQKNYTFELSTSLPQDNGKTLTISPQTDIKKSEPIWINSEFYFFGTIVDAGGKTNPNIHLDVKNVGVITISAGREYLAMQEKNMLYHECGVRVSGVQNIATGEYGQNFELIEIIDYSPVFDESYLNECIRRASRHFKGVDAQKFLDEIRGGKEYA